MKPQVYKFKANLLDSMSCTFPRHAPGAVGSRHSTCKQTCWLSRELFLEAPSLLCVARAHSGAGKANLPVLVLFPPQALYSALRIPPQTCLPGHVALARRGAELYAQLPERRRKSEEDAALKATTLRAQTSLPSSVLPLRVRVAFGPRKVLGNDTFGTERAPCLVSTGFPQCQKRAPQVPNSGHHTTPRA
ncbi:hypothetical protein SRHO_G00004050 [Serrasalmus rhombeus]